MPGAQRRRAFVFVTALSCNRSHDRDAALQEKQKIQQFQGFIVAEISLTRGRDTSL
jgi:hypothetical protein